MTNVQKSFIKKKFFIYIEWLRKFYCIGVSGLNLLTLDSGLTPPIGYEHNLANIVWNSFFLKKKVFSVAQGCFFKSVAHNTFKLSSGILYFSVFMPRYRGKLPVVFKSSKKFSFYFFRGSKLVVRGVAKNANEHKNGGSGRGGINRFFRLS